MTLIQPVLKGDALRRQMLETTVDDGFAVWWLGQSGFLLKAPAGVVLFDPYLSDSLTEKYARTDKPHVRMTELAIRPGRLDFVDVVTSTHNHTDHLDAATLQPLMRVNDDLTLVIPEANRGFARERLGCDRDWPVGLDAGEQRDIGGFTFHGIAAAHNDVERDEHGRCRFLGYVVTFEAAGKPCAVYHSGDTLWHDGLIPALQPFDIDLAILPINGHRPERRVAGNLFGDEAAKLGRAIGADLVVPCHFQMFEFNTEPPDLFVETCETLGQRCRVLRCGERLSIEKKLERSRDS